MAGFVMEHVRFINGYPWGAFEPDTEVTRAEAAEMLYRLLDKDAVKRRPHVNFSDVGEGDWFADAVTFLTSIGIVHGYEDGTFRPDNRITRAEFATMISGFSDIDIVVYNAFVDIRGHWALVYINNAASKGWISGYPDSCFRPDNNMTRAEVVTVIDRMLNRKIEREDVPSWAQHFTDLPDTHWAYTAIAEASIGHEYMRKPNGYEIWIDIQDE